MKRHNIFAALLPLLLTSEDGWFNDHPQPKQKMKKCLWCGNEHSHNNSFCCTECCRLYKEKKKNEKT